MCMLNASEGMTTPIENCMFSTIRDPVYLALHWFMTCTVYKREHELKT